MVLFIALCVLWVILNGRVTLEICIFGVVISLVICLFARKFLCYGQEKSTHPVRNAGLMIRYLLTLIGEVVKASVAVVRISFAGRLHFEPAIVYFKTDLKRSSLRVLLANSISLKPGTVTVILDDGRYCVHCLDKALAEGINTSAFVRLLKRMEEG